VAQEGTGLDYECDLVAVIGKQCIDVPESKALAYVGYTEGNDISHRDLDSTVGPRSALVIVSTPLIPDPQTLKITTKLNGSTMHESDTADVIFGLKKSIAFLPGNHLAAGRFDLHGNVMKGRNRECIKSLNSLQRVGMVRTPQRVPQGRRRG
jgi:2-keto-4-pentenoate hydratase/2-oxohepta-3-ene-1,7-dioic acid hydratase in catechol pathway